MRMIFADTAYWIARMNPRDQWHAQVGAIGITLSNSAIVTTDEVLAEVLAYFCSYGPEMRSRASGIARNLVDHPDDIVFPQSRQSFLDGLALYEGRPDKAYSLTDCISMQLMRREGIMDVLTHDIHFAQEGFRRLF